MAAKFSVVRGTKDILPAEAERFNEIKSKAGNIFSVYGYRQIYTPILESKDLFIRSLGEETEIVGKQMFLIQREDNDLVLRPEATAGVVRAYIENNLARTEGFVKLFYIGPMFRAERPQKGRLRQFHHIGVEAIGSDDASLDAEIISLADSILKSLLIDGYEIKLNSLGCLSDKKRLSDTLRNILSDKLNLLCDDCQGRYERNVFRVLDCKNKACRKVISGLTLKRSDYLCDDCLAHFESVLVNLDAIGVGYTDCVYLMRGLDYYTRTVFEITHAGLGAQDAIGAGGRYDNLVEELGGNKTPAIGFAFGVERLILARNKEIENTLDNNLVYIIPLGDAAKRESFKILSNLRAAGIISDTVYTDKSLKGAMRKANDLGARFVLIVGDDELAKNVVTVKDMKSGEQNQISRNNLIEELKC
ncbi:MAG TPA: histidine--tRNA ligase [Candidatus Omnitrophica bacterium]|nr:histidine--tRNA ligase [Candidatus Omnitrophota bacterium]